MPKTAYKRILLKLSGEVLAGEQGFGIDPKKAKELAGLFIANFKQYTDNAEGKALVAAGPQI